MINKKIVNLIASKAVFKSNLGLLTKVMVVSTGGSNIAKDTVKEINKSTYAGISASGETKKILDTFFVAAPNESISVLELTAVSTGDETIQKKVERFKAMLDNETLDAYMFIMPSNFFPVTEMSNLVKEYNDINKMKYFVLPFTVGTDISTDVNLPKYANTKSTVVIYDMLKDTEKSVLGVFAAVYLNNFKISASNTMRGFDYIFSKGLDIKDLNKKVISQLDQKNLVYLVNIIGQPSFVNVKTQDGEYFTNSIAYDNLSILVVDRLTNTLVTANNTVNGAIEYDDSGIILLKSVIENELINCKNLKLIEKFGASYNSTTNKIEDQDEIAYIPFNDYVSTASGMTDLRNGAYNGFSFECSIQKFILTINISTNIR